jgi:hypothetical protein
LDQVERDEWYDKLRNWDSSANEEEGVFASARYAAKLGWENVHLKNVLKGDHIGKFKEPRDLSMARLAQLERQERYEEGLNLAKAVDMDFYVATFLLKMNRLAEAEQAAKTIEDAEKLFNIAKIAKPLDVNIAFNLIIKSISAQTEWNGECQERTAWLCDLAISSKILDRLVQDISKSVKSKTVQFEVAKILKNKEQHKHSLQLCKHVLKPYDPLPVPQPTEQPAPAASSSAIPTPTTPTIEVDTSRFVPNNAALWTWDLVYEMVLLELTDDKDMRETLTYILDVVEDVQQLNTLLNGINTKFEHEQVIVVGSKMFERLEQMVKREHELQVELINALLDVAHNPEFANNPAVMQATQQQVQMQLMQRVQQQNQLSQVYQNQVYPSMNLAYNQTWDNMKNQVANTMINAALESRRPELQINPPTIVLPRRAQPIQRKPKPFELDAVQQVVTLCLKHVTITDHIMSFARTLMTRQEYKLGLTVVDKCYDRIREMKKTKTERDATMQELAVLRNEINELLAQRKPAKPEQRRKLRELEYKERLFQLRPHTENYHLDYYNEQIFSMAQLAAVSVLNSKQAIEAEKQLSKEIIEQTVHKSIEVLERPNDLVRLAQDLRTRKEYIFLLRATKRAISLVNAMEKAREARERVSIPLMILTEEQNTFMNNKQPTPAALANEIVKLQQQLAAFPQPQSYDPNSADGYDQLYQQIGVLAVTAVLESKQPAPTPAVGFGYRVMPVAQPQVPTHVFSDDEVQDIVEEYLVHVQSPTGLYSLVNSCNGYGQYNLMIFLSEKAQDRIAYLADEVKKREMPRLELQALRQEKLELEKERRNLTAEQVQQLKNMDLEQRTLRSLLPSYYFSTLTQFDNEMKKVTTLVINSLLARKKALQQQLQNILDQEAMGVERMETEDDENSKEKIQDRIVDFSNKINHAVQRGLRFIRNPSEMIRIATILKDNQEFELVPGIGKKVQERILEIAEERKQREKVLDELAELEQEELQLQEQQKITKKKAKLDAAKAERMAKLRLQRDFYGIFPSYMNLSDEDLEDVHLDNAKVLLDGALAKRDIIESDEKLLPSEKEEQLKKQDKDINDIIDVCLKYVQNPKHITVLMEQVQRSNDIDLMLKLGRKCLERVVFCEKKRTEYDTPSQLVAILEKEQEQLQLLRKTLEPKLKGDLDAAHAKIDAMDLPNYILSSSHDDFSTWKYKALSKMLQAVLQRKQRFEQRITTDQSLTTEQIEAETKTNTANIASVVDLIIKSDIGIENPHNLNAVISDLFNKNEFKFVITVGNRAFAVLDKLRHEYDARQLPEQHYLLLERENEQLLGQRKQLPNDKQDQLRELKLKHNLNSLKPKYYNNSSEENDKLAFLISRSMIFGALELKKEAENKMEMDSQTNEEEVSKTSSESFEYVKKIVNDCLHHVLVIENIVKLAQELSEKLEYDLTLQVGKVCQHRIQELHAKIKKIKELDEEKQNILQKLKLPTRTIEQQVRLQEIEIELAKLPLKYQSEAAIDALMLHVGKMLLNAAKVVNDNQVLREQAVIVFKININLETFGEVKVLTPEHDWEKLRKELLKYVVQKIKQKTEEMKEGKLDEDTGESTVDLDLEAPEEDVAMEDEDSDEEEGGRGRRRKKAPRKTPKKSKRRASGGLTVKRSTLREMIELLLSEGMWKECVDVFPEPQYGNISLLERLWLDVESNDSKNLDNLLPLVESYCTKDFLNYEYSNCQTLLDMVRAYDADWEAKLYNTVTEKLLLNVVQKQYASFVDLLKFIKNRLTEKQWDKFIEQLKKKHKAKKKLMSQIEMEGL